jgi:hypothetical protein
MWLGTEGGLSVACRRVQCISMNHWTPERSCVSDTRIVAAETPTPPAHGVIGVLRAATLGDVQYPHSCCP